MKKLFHFYVKEETHLRVKKYCAECGLKMNDFVDNLVREKLDKLNYK